MVAWYARIEKTLTSNPALIFSNFKEPFLLITDASAFTISAVFSQGTVGKDLPIAYTSWTLCTAETGYSTSEYELPAIVWQSVKHFRSYLFEICFTPITDHRPLTLLFSIQEPCSKLARWWMKLDEYNYKIEYKPGKERRCSVQNQDQPFQTKRQLKRGNNTLKYHFHSTQKKLFYIYSTLCRKTWRI